jgi:hypothetical protein
MRQRTQATLTFILLVGWSGFGQGCGSRKTAVSDGAIVDRAMTGSGGGTGARGGTGGGSGGAAIDGGGGNVASGTGGRWFDSPDGPQACSQAECPAGQVCAVAVWNGATNVDRCLPLPDNCVDCACAQAVLAAYYAARFPPPQGLPPRCGCWDASHNAIDGGTGPVAGVSCTGA